MLVHPSFAAKRSLSADELIERLSNNCVSVTYADFSSYQRKFHSAIVEALSRNDRVNKVFLNGSFFEGDAETIRALIAWLRARGNKCDLLLLLSFRDSGGIQLGERMFAFLSSSESSINIKEVTISGASTTVSEVESALVTNILSLLSKNTRLNLLRSHESILPYIGHVAELDSLEFPFTNEAVPLIPFLSHRNIRRFEISIYSTPALGALVDALKTYHSAGGTRLSEIALNLYIHDIRSARLPELLSRIPPRLSLGICFNNPAADDLPFVAKEMLSVPRLRRINLRCYPEHSLSGISEFEELFHGRIEHFELDAGRLVGAVPARSLTCFRASDLVTLRFLVRVRDKSLVTGLAEQLAELVPTMNRLKDLFVMFRLLGQALPNPPTPKVRNQQEHDEFMASPITSVDLRLRYVAYDNLVEAVCQSSSITNCVICTKSPGPRDNNNPLSQWQQDRLCFALKTRLIRVNTLLLTAIETSPLSLLPLALSTLSVGHWYDVMAYIVRQKSDQLIRDYHRRSF